MSLRKRKLVEEAFGWVKTIAGCAKVKVRESLHVPQFRFTLAMAASNLIRLPKRIEELKAKIKLAFPAAYQPRPVLAAITGTITTCGPLHAAAAAALAPDHQPQRVPQRPPDSSRQIRPMAPARNASPLLRRIQGVSSVPSKNSVPQNLKCPSERRAHAARPMYLCLR